MKNPPLLFFFALALFALSFGTLFFPSIRFIVFAPFFAIVFQRKNMGSSLWIATLCGLCVDLLSSDLRFGAFAVCSLVAAAITHNLRNYFFEEKLLSIPLYTALISIVFSAAQFFFIRHLITINLQWTLSTFLVMPMIDALYGFVWFTCPKLLYCIFKRGRKWT